MCFLEQMFYYWIKSQLGFVSKGLDKVGSLTGAGGQFLVFLLSGFHLSVLVGVLTWCKYKNMNILPTAQHLKAIIISLVSERLGYIMVLYQSSPWFPVHHPLSAIHHLLYKWFECGNSKETGWIVLKFGSHIGSNSVPSRDCRDMVVIELKMIEEKRVHSYALYFMGHLFLWNLWFLMMFTQYKFSWFWKYLLCPPIFNYTILKHSSVDNIILMWL